MDSRSFLGIETRPSFGSGSTTARPRMYSLQKAACERLKILSFDLTCSLWRSHSSKVYISRQGVKMSFFTTNLMSPSAGIKDLNGAGKTTLPLSSIFDVYSPINVIMSCR